MFKIDTTFNPRDYSESILLPMDRITLLYRDPADGMLHTQSLSNVEYAGTLCNENEDMELVGALVAHDEATSVTAVTPENMGKLLGGREYTTAADINDTCDRCGEALCRGCNVCIDCGDCPCPACRDCGVCLGCYPGENEGLCENCSTTE